MKQDSPSAVKSLDRGLDILEFIARARHPPTFSRLLGELGIPRSSLFHLLTNLQARGFVARDDATDGYCLGPSLRQLVRAAPQRALSSQVSPFLQALSAELNETCGFYVRAGDMVEVIASAISMQTLSYTMKVGARAPLHAVSAGKIVLAEIGPDALNAYLGGTPLAAITPHTVRSKERVRKEIQAARASGFAYSHEEFTPGITAIATAVRHNGVFVGAINVAVPTVRFTPDREASFRDALRATADGMADALD